MLRALHVKNFRGLQDLRVEDLGRVNLFVGANNSGKTSLLEALHFVMNAGQLSALLSSSRRRGELALRELNPTSDSSAEDGVIDARYLFHGRELEGGRCEFHALDHLGMPYDLEFSVRRLTQGDLESGVLRLGPRLAPARPMALESAEGPVALGMHAGFLATVSSRGHVLNQAVIDEFGAVDERNLLFREPLQGSTSAPFLRTSLLGHAQLARLLDRAVLGNEEQSAVEAMAVVEPRITRVAAVERTSGAGGRAIVVGVKGSNQLIPLGNLGEGMSRLLSIALALVSARGGALIIDEIDTGLHHSVMAKMWRLIFETAKRLNVSVYASTHSYDCVHALASIASDDDPYETATLTRIEREPARAVHFNPEEIRRLADREIEAR